MKNLSTFIFEKLDNYWPSGMDSLWWKYSKGLKSGTFNDASYFPNMSKEKDDISDDTFIADFVEMVTKINITSPEIFLNFLPLCYLLDKKYNIRLMNVQINGGPKGDGTIGIQYALPDNYRKKLILEDDSMNWMMNTVRAKDYSPSHTTDWTFADVKGPKEYAQQLLKLVHKNFDKK